MASTTELRSQITTNIVTQLEKMLTDNFDTDIFYTGGNYGTLTFSCGEVDGKEIYGSIKFTLHKSNYDLDNEIEKFEDFWDEKQLKAKLAAQNKEEKERKLAEKKARAAAKVKAEKIAKERQKRSIANMREQIKEEANTNDVN